MIPRRWAYTYPGEWAELGRWLRAEGEMDDGLIAGWEHAVAEYTGVPYTAAMSSGRRGMALIFEHIKLGPGDEVIIPAYTLGELIPLIQSFGARVIPADIDPYTLNISPESVEKRITAKTKAILVLHAFGNPCDVGRVVALAAARGIRVIEDCAHSLGATIAGAQTGSFGYAAFFSFETTKPVNTFGGGMAASRDASLIEHIRRSTAKDACVLAPLRKKRRVTRMEQWMFRTMLGFPLLYLLATPSCKTLMNRLYRRAQSAFPGTVRYSPIQAKLGLAKLRTLPHRVQARNARVNLLKSLLLPAIRVQHVEDKNQSTRYFCVAILPVPASPVRKRLLLRGIDAGVEGEIADNCAAALGYDDCPIVTDIFPRAIALPMYDDIQEAAIHRIARTLNALIGAQPPHSGR